MMPSPEQGLVFVFGLIVGSFLNVVIHRGPVMWDLIEQTDGRKGNLLFPRSYCPKCGATLAPVSLIPILGFLIQRGRCSVCLEPIHWRYPLIELAGAFTAVIAFGLHGFSMVALVLAVCLWTMIVLAAIDLETGYLPDALTIPLIALGIGFNSTGQMAPFMDALIGAIVGYVVFRAIGAVFLRVRGIEGLGQGDAKLLAATGAWAGWTVLAPTVFVSALGTLLIVGAINARGGEVNRETEIPFGPALAAASALFITALSAGWPPERILSFILA